MRSVLPLLFVLSSALGWAQPATSNYSRTWQELIDGYRSIEKRHPATAHLSVAGPADGPNPIHLFKISAPKAKNECRIFILNGIHPGEPEGMDACMELAEVWAKNPVPGLEILIVPAYNVEGMRNRSSYSRANQNGPEAYGFRGNGRNLDLNRDMVKADSRNARTLAKLLALYPPDVFFDTHTSNGADYPYTLTLIATQREKLGGKAAELLYDKLQKRLVDSLRAIGQKVVPYVNTVQETPDSGLIAFMETPRFVSGYLSLLHIPAFVVETHMLKSFDQRKKATLDLLKTSIPCIWDLRKDIRAAIQADQWASHTPKEETIRWETDLSRADSLEFEGYTAKKIPSKIGNYNRLMYEHTAWKRNIPWFEHAKAVQTVKVPKAYILPYAWEDVRSRLANAGVRYREITRDTLVLLHYYRILNYETSKRPYEGHYPHSGVQVELRTDSILLSKGDWILPTQQEKGRMLVHLLEPQATDSYFNWNFFDAILQQKEYFSDYVFEDMAFDFLEKNPSLKAEFESTFPATSEKRKDKQEILGWIYKHSPWYEKTHLRYPIFLLPH